MKGRKQSSTEEKKNATNSGKVGCSIALAVSLMN